MRVAIVGQGPRGVQALFALAETWRERGAQGGGDLEVVCFDPRPAGSGAAYAPGQPDCLRLNVRADILDLPGCPSFVEWLRSVGEPTGDVSRRFVGLYLGQMRERLLADLPGGMTVTTCAQEVAGLDRVGDRWQVRTGAEVSNRAGVGPFDEVLLAVGHAPPTGGLVAERDTASASAPRPGSALPRLVPAVYPVDRYLDDEHVPPGARVVVRGAALTFIDAALVLSGRPTFQRPAVVIPTSRSGLLMNTKPLPLLPDDVEAGLLGTVRARCGDGAVETLASVRKLSINLLAALAIPSTHVEMDRLRRCIDDLLDGAGLSAPVRVRLAESIALAEAAENRTGPPGGLSAEAMAEWALGRAWVLLYPDLVAALSWRDDLPESFWAEFRRQATRYERLTFGPTLPQARRLLALCDAGFVDTAWLDARRTLDDIPAPEWREHADVVIDAVLAPPGLHGNARPIVTDLLARGLVAQADDGRRGLLIDQAARCLDADRSPTPGLSCVGRVSEDIVIGHDTLNRYAHPHLARWAARIGERV